MKKRLCFMLVIAFLIASVFPIDFSGEQNSVQAASVKLSKTSVTLEIGSSIKLKMIGTKKAVKWSTTNKAVATVTGKGTVKAKGEGKCYIKAKVGKKIYKCKVVVVISETEDLLQVSSNKLQTELGHTAVLAIKLAEEGSVNYDVLEQPKAKALHHFWGSWDNNVCRLYLYATELGTYKIRISNSINDEVETVSLVVDKKVYCKSFDVSTLRLNVMAGNNEPTRLNVFVEDYYADGIIIYTDGIVKESQAELTRECGSWIYDVNYENGTASAFSKIKKGWTGSILPIYIKGTAPGGALMRIYNSKNDEYIDILISVTE